MRRPISSSCVPMLDNRARSLEVLTCGSLSCGRNSGLPAGAPRYDERLPMLARIDLRGIADVRSALARPPAGDADISAAVAAIVTDVRVRGDDALRDCTERFDGFRPDALTVAADELDAALDRIDA